ncbi:MAG: LLM class F420-dependent oxidoreductase [Solirubrobacteraceae bacterium]
MRTAISLSAEERSWDELITYVLEAERLGVDICWVTEGWGGDAVSPLGFLAARTERIKLGSGVFQLGTRTPAAIAMAAMTIAMMSEGRFLLGLGASGPQVIEGLHGVRFDHPLGRMRESIEIIRLLRSGERSAYAGRHFQLPVEGSEARPMSLSLPPNAELPLYVAALSPRMLELTGELADGWLGTSFVPERADAFLDPIASGAARAGRGVGEIDICQHAEVSIGEDVEAYAAVQRRRLAFYLGGMGSPERNFYYNAYARQGFSDVARTVHDLWVAKRRDQAIAAVPDELVFATSLIGTDDMVRERLRAWRDAGVDTIRMTIEGTLDERLATLARAVELVAESAVRG